MASSDDIKDLSFVLSTTDGLAKTGDDIKGFTRVCLAQYLSDQTHGKDGDVSDARKRNPFPIDPASNVGGTVVDEHPSLNSPTTGESVGPTESTNSSQYAPSDAHPTLDRYSNSEYGDTSFIHKGSKKVPYVPGDIDANPDGHRLLINVQGTSMRSNASTVPGNDDRGVSNPNENTKQVQSHVDSILTGFSRFNVESKFIDNSSDLFRREQPGPDGSQSDPQGRPRGGDDGRLIATIQKTPGVYDPNAPAIPVRAMRKVGAMLGFRATGEAFMLEDDADPDNAGDRTSVLLPGVAQLINPGQPAGSMADSDLRARKALADLMGGEPTGGRAARDDILRNNTPGLDDTRGGRSHGQMLNSIDKFTGLLPLGMVALHIILAVIIFLGIQLVLLTLGSFIKPTRAIRNNDGSSILGRFVSSTAGGLFDSPTDFFANIGQFLGFKPVSFEFNRCVNTGIFVFFGVEDIDADPAGAILDFAINEPGRFAIFSRMLTRSVGTIAGAFTDFSVASVTDVVESFTGILQVIRESKLIKAINFLAQLGNTRLLLRTHFKDAEINNAQAKLSGIDKIEEDEESFPGDVAPYLATTTQKVRKSRIGSSLRLAWANSTVSSMLLLPDNILTADNAFRARTTQASAYNASRGVVRTKPNAVKISDEMRRAIEADLDAEYVPFYFHDLRTNEIIAFHAFLDSLDESFNANYEQSTAFGRVDPVRTYSHTERSIDFTFKAVATSHEDFDTMWAKINKLTTLLYPQWSEGRIVRSDNGTTFAQPFSQIMTASPLIRLRIGDLIRTNYSRFNLGRIFGLGDADKFRGTSNSAMAVEKTVRERIDLIRRGNINIGDPIIVRPMSDPVSSAFNTGYRPVENDGIDLLAAIDPFAGSTSIPMPLRNTTSLKAKVTNFDATTGKIQFELAGDDASITVMNNNGGFIAYASDITPDIERIIVAAGGVVNDGVREYDKLESIEKFFAPETNPIVRSFESAGGKGLAGHILSLTYDYSEATWETEVYGSRAPKILSIAVSFAPVHDIAPGIDHRGFNRAPTHNVGRAVNAIAGDGDDIDSIGRNRFEIVKRRDEKARNDPSTGE